MKIRLTLFTRFFYIYPAQTLNAFVFYLHRFNRNDSVYIFKYS